MPGYPPLHRFFKNHRFLLGLSFLSLMMGLFLVAIPDVRAAQQVTVAWDANSEPDLAGYKVYYGTSSRNYATSRDAGKVYSYTIADLQEGTTFYIAATAYDRYGNESAFSQEVVYSASVSNHAPVAQSGTLSTNQDTAATGTLTATDPDGDSLTYTLITQGSNGVVTIIGATSGAYRYTPNSGARGSDTFTFQVADADGLTSTATVAVTIVPVNHAPIAQSGTLSTNQDTAATGTLTATDPDGDSLTYALVTQGSNGVVTIIGANTGAYRYTPNSGARGSDTFTFRVADADGLTSSATVAVTIVPVNHAPAAQNGTLSTNQDTSATGTLVATDPDSDALTYSVTTQGAKGAVTITGATSGAYRYTPTSGARGSDTFTFRVADAGGLTSTATVAVTIVSVNHAPAAQNGTLSTNQDTSATGTLVATDPDSDVLTYSVTTQGAKGAVTITGATSGAYRYTPTSGARGSDTFTFRVADAGGLTSTATVAVTIVPVNHAPAAQNGTLSTNQDTSATGTLVATDPDSDALTYSVATQGAKGAVTIIGANTGAYRYTPNSGARGSDTFTFQVADAGGLTSTATVAVTIVPVNHAPAAQNGTLSTNQDTSATGTLVATDPDSDALTYSVATQGAKGAVTIIGANTGAYRYTPNSGARGSDTFTFQVADADGLTSSATVAVTIVPVNHAPTAQNGTLSTNQDTSATGTLVATDPDSDVLTYSVATQGAKGAVTITGANIGAYRYTPNSGARGSDTFTFRVADAGGLTSTATVAVTIVPVNHAPTAQNGTLSTNQDTSATGTLVATDPDSDVLTYSVATQGAKGAVTITGANIGAYRYTPNSGARGSDTFTFRVADAGGLTSTAATVAVTIVPVNHAPAAQNGTLSTNQDTSATGTLVATDPDSDVLTYSVATQAGKGTVVIANAATGAYTYTPTANVTGSDSFTFGVRDAGGLTATASVTVTIVPVNHAPIAQNGTLFTYRGAIRSGQLAASDPDGNALIHTIASQGKKGTAVVTNASTGVFSYTPNRGSKGEDSFTFMVQDPGGLTATATVVVRIISLGNKAPVAIAGTVTTIQDTPISGKLDAADADGDLLGYEIVVAPKLGVLSLDAATGAFTYTPQAGGTGTDSFTFKANDGEVDSNVASVNVVVNAHVKIVLEAEDGTLTAPMVRAKDTKASNGKYIWVPNGKGNVSDSLNPGGQAVYSFSVPTSGNYQIWARVVANNIRNNSFFVSMDYGASIAWHTAIGAKNTWIWDHVMDKNDPNSLSFYLDAGTHTLVIKQMEDGTKLDSILITTQSGWMRETVYCDAENGGTEGWDVFDAASAGALITNVFDEDRAGYVIQMSGSRKDNGYRLHSESLSNWANENQFVIEWSMKYDENYIIYVEVQTTSGYRYLQYEPINVDHLGASSQVRLGLGTGTKDGQWHTFVRDLQADLTKAQEGVQILQVNTFAIRGSGKVDDIKLRQAI